MHVLVIPSWYPSASEPVRGSFFREQALALTRAGVRVGVLVIPTRVRTWHGLGEVRRARGRPPELIGPEHDQGLATYRLDWWGALPSLLPQRRKSVVLRAFDRYVAEQGRVDIVHAHGALYAGVVAAHLGAERGVPVVLTEHLSALISRRLFPDQLIRAGQAIRSADRRLAVGARLASAMQRCAPGVDVEVVGNLVDTVFFSPGAGAPKPPPFVLATVGALDPRKGLDVLLRAFARAFTGAPVSLEVAGGGPERARLERLVHAMKLSGQVHFRGALSRTSVRDLLQRSHALVSASHLETFGVTLIEAMACGLPIVATRSGGPENIVTTKSGVLVAPNDADALARGLRAVVERYDTFDPVAIRRDCVARFGDGAITARLTALYSELLAWSQRSRPGT